MKISKPFDNVLGKTKCGKIVSYSPIAKIVAIGEVAVGVTPNEIAYIGYKNDKLIASINVFNNHSYKKYK